MKRRGKKQRVRQLINKGRKERKIERRRGSEAENNKGRKKDGTKEGGKAYN